MTFSKGWQLFLVGSEDLSVVCGLNDGSEVVESQVANDVSYTGNQPTYSAMHGSADTGAKIDYTESSRVRVPPTP